LLFSTPLEINEEATSCCTMTAHSTTMQNNPMLRLLQIQPKQSFAATPSYDQQYQYHTSPPHPPVHRKHHHSPTSSSSTTKPTISLAYLFIVFFIFICQVSLFTHGDVTTIPSRVTGYRPFVESGK
jgi:hypothetical protein